MKILLLLQARAIEDQINYLESFKSATLSNGEKVEVRALPFISLYRELGSDGFCQTAITAAREFLPDVVFFQFFHGTTPNPSRLLLELKRMSPRPLIFASQGDPFWVGFGSCIARPPEPDMRILLPYVDAYFSSSMGELGHEFVRLGAKNVIFLPHAWSHQHFVGFNPGDRQEPEYDVMMCCGVQRWPGLQIPLQIASSIVQRYYTAISLHHAFKDRFALYGRGWYFRWAKGAFQFKDQATLFLKGKVVVDAPPPIYATYYASDRPFFVAGTGTPLVMPYVRRFEKVFRDNEHIYFAHGVRDIAATCRRVLGLPLDLLEKRRADLISLIEARHTTEKRVDTMLSTYEALIAVRDGRKSSEDALRMLRLWHFLPDLNLDEEYPHAVFNWNPEEVWR